MVDQDDLMLATLSIGMPSDEDIACMAITLDKAVLKDLQKEAQRQRSLSLSFFSFF